MPGYYGDFRVGQTVRCRFNTVSGSNLPATLAAGAVTVSRDGVDVTPAGGVTLAVDAGGVTGRHVVVIDTSADPATFTAGSDYAVRLSGTSNVAGNSVLGAYVGEWSVANRAVAPQGGDVYARVGAAGSGLTALGDARLAHLDADVSSRGTSNYAGGAVAAVTAPVTVGVNNDKDGYRLAATGLDLIPGRDPLAVDVVAAHAAGVYAGTQVGSLLADWSTYGTTVVVSDPTGAATVVSFRLAPGASAEDGAYLNQWLEFRAPSLLAGQRRQIVGYAGLTRTVTFAAGAGNAFSRPPADGDVGVIT